MTKLTTLFLLCLCASFAACSDDGGDSIDTEGCEHLRGGPYTAITASAARDATAPAVAASHMAFTTTLPAGAVGYVAFAAPEATDYVVFLDKPVPLAVFDAAGASVAIEASETSSEACAEIRGKHTFELGVGTAYLGLGPNSGMPFNLVIEEADHEH